MTHEITIPKSEYDRLIAEIARLQDAKRRALQIADMRAKENVQLRRQVEQLLRLGNLISDSPIISTGCLFHLKSGRTSAPLLPKALQDKARLNIRQSEVIGP